MGSFDGPFSASELRRALGVDSAAGFDGVPCSLFKVPFLWWQRALLNFFNFVLSWGVVPTRVETEHCGARLQTVRRRSRHQLSPHLSCVVLFQTLRASGPFPDWTAHHSNSTSVREDSDGC